MKVRNIGLRPNGEEWELAGTFEGGEIFVLKLNFHQIYLLCEDFFKVLLGRVRRK